MAGDRYDVAELVASGQRRSADLGDVTTDELVAGICATAGVVDQAIRDARRCRAAGARRTAIRVELMADDELRRLVSLCVELRSRLA